MEKQRISQLPTRLNAEQAWEEYRALAQAVVDDHSLSTNLAHNIATARAWSRWCEIFLTVDRAA